MLVKRLPEQVNNKPQRLITKPQRNYRKVISKFFQIFFAVSLLAISFSITYLILEFNNESFTPARKVKNIAGQSIIKTAEVINPNTEEKRYVSTLIMGIDTRGVKFDGEKYIQTRSDGTRKIDVIMQVVYDRQQDKLIYISIPRDTSLPVTEECMHQEREDQKYINRVYDMAEKNNCPQNGAEMMKKYVSYITGYDVDYYVIVTLDSFVDLINIVGETHQGKKGVWIDVPRNISDYCPNKSFGYNHVYFAQGRQFMTADRVLCYVRVRKSSSDFDRNKRQQQLITEVAKLLANNETLSNPIKLMQIYSSNKGKIQMSDIKATDISMGIEILAKLNLDNTQKIVLDYEFGGTNSYLTKPLYSKPGTHSRAGYYLIPTAWDRSCCSQDEWKLVREYLHSIIEDQNAQPTQASVFTYVNKLKGSQAVFDNASYMAFKGKADSYQIYFHESKHALPMITTGPDIQIFDFSGGKKRHIAQQIADLTGGTVYDGKSAPFKQANNEEIAVVVRVK